MILTNGTQIENNSIYFNITKIINQVYKLLPMRQEGQDWQKPLQTLIEELSGMKRLISGQDNLFFLILCKLEGLFNLKEKKDMQLYRRIIFESLNLLNSLKDNVCEQS